MGFFLMTSMKTDPLYCKFTLKARQYTRSLMLVISMFLTTLAGRSQKFPASAIPDSLKENADVVVRLGERSYEIKSSVEALSHERYVFTILNEKGEHSATYRTYYNNKSVIINSVNAYLYDANGKEIRHFKKKDMEDHPAFDGSSFVNDERYLLGSFSYSSYPYTVEFDEEDEIHELLEIRNWFPQSSTKNSLERGTYSITFPADYKLQYKMLNSEIKPALEEKGNKKILRWEIKGLTAYDDLPFSLDYSGYAPYLMIGLSDVQMGDYKGNMSSWDEYAKFYGSLQKGRDVLPAETRQKVQELIKGLNSPESKVAVLYNYLQQNTHYVGIQLGIGGWQTYDATYVATKKYGDCKALSNFMIALLKEAGIKGHAVVIHGGQESREFVKDFTNDPFNHIICCVPLEKDTIWLECTSQFLPAGYLSNSTSNRYGLFIDDAGGGLVHTPAYLLPDNIQSRQISAVLDAEGNLNVDCNTSYKAYCQDDLGDIIHYYSKEEQLSWLKSKFSLPTYEVVSFNYTEDFSRRLPVIRESLNLSVNNYAQITGKRIFINPNILTRSTRRLTKDDNRRLGVSLKEEYHYMDSVQISIPSGYEMESKSTDLVLKNKFGSYSTKTLVTGNKIMYYRSLEQYSGYFPARDYAEVVKFYNDMYDADHTSIVLVKKN
jgi:hypothetical protein